jgi:hypothetical protein
MQSVELAAVVFRVPRSRATDVPATLPLKRIMKQKYRGGLNQGAGE